jgi:predicted lipoprotein with Yx(FWY)xxD motif
MMLRKHIFVAGAVAVASSNLGDVLVDAQGRTVYRFAGDQKAGDTNGQGVNAFGGSWYALTSAGNQVTATSPSTGPGNGY